MQSVFVMPHMTSDSLLSSLCGLIMLTSWLEVNTAEFALVKWNRSDISNYSEHGGMVPI